MKNDKLVLNSKALGEMGLKCEEIYTIEYDLNSVLKIPKNISPEAKKEAQKRNRLAKEFRNRLHFILKFKLHATRHLESCWILSEKSLDFATEQLEAFKSDMKAKGFSDVDERIRIIPILTTEAGFESFTDKKAEFILEFAMEHIKYCEKAKKEQKIARGTLWRCKEAYSICATLKEELKGNKRYNELVDTVEALGESVALVEPLVKSQNEKEA